MTFDELVALDALDAAPLLLGWTLLVDGVGGRIVEVEAYREDDPASHSYAGATTRTATMFGAGGLLYVYRSYGIHWCANVVCGPEGTGSAVLLRALEPTHDLAAMRARRGDVADRLLCSGPGRLTQALAITGSDDGARVGAGRFEVRPGEAVGTEISRRIGITKAADREWRFTERGSSWVSRAPRRP